MSHLETGVIPWEWAYNFCMRFEVLTAVIRLISLKSCDM
jgi:hypothetical protein